MLTDHPVRLYETNNNRYQPVCANNSANTYRSFAIARQRWGCLGSITSEMLGVIINAEVYNNINQQER